MDIILKTVAVTLLCSAFLQGSARGHPLRTNCAMAKYKPIITRAMTQATGLQNLQEFKGHNPDCHHGIRLKKIPKCDIQGKERLALTLHRVSLTVKVLENMTVTHLVRHNLDTFSSLQSDLSKCVTKSREMESCLHHLTKHTERMSAECLQEDVLLNLVWILVEDLGSLIQGASDGNGSRKKDPQLLPKKHVPKKKKRKGKPKRGEQR